MALILVADDDRDLAQTLKDLIEAWGHKAVLAANGAEALLRAQEWRPDLILMDIQMPGVYGPGAYRSLQSAGLAADTPVIFMTGASADEAGKVVPKSANARLALKPLEPSALRKLIEELLPKKKRKPTTNDCLGGKMRSKKHAEMVEVLATGDPSQVALAKSLLEAEKIAFVAQGDIHSAIEARFPVRFLVAGTQAGKARRALAGLRGS